MQRLPTPVWIEEIVEAIARHYDLPIPAIEFKQYPAVKYVYGFPKKGPDAGKRIKYQKEYGEGAYRAHAQSPGPKHPNGRIVIRVRDPELEILPMIVLHEMGHIVADAGGRRANHSVEFYWQLYRLAEQYGPGLGFDPVDLALWESGYKSRNAVDGYRAFSATRPLSALEAA